MATALFLSNNHGHSLPLPQGQITHVCVSGLKNRKPRSRSRCWSCSDNRGLVANPPTRNANYLRSIRSGARECQNARTDLVRRRRLKLSLIESTVDWIEGSKNSETCALCTRMSRSRFINRVGVNLPSQSYPPGLDSVVEIVVPRRTKFDVLICTATRSRKDLLHSFVKLLGERCQVFGVVKF